MEISKETLDLVKSIVAKNGELDRDINTVGLSDDLFSAGMSSRATVGVMLDIEETFDIAFPDEMISREVFESIEAISKAVETLKN
jgi:acyl carrier protein